MKKSTLIWVIAIVVVLALFGIAVAVYFGLFGGIQRSVSIPQSDTQIRATPVALGYETAVGAAWRTERFLYVFEKIGLVHRIDLTQQKAAGNGNNSNNDIVVLDLRQILNEVGVSGRGGEQGLLGLAFDPNRADRVYVAYSAPAVKESDKNHVARLSQFTIENANQANERFVAERIVLDIPQSTRFHHGQTIEFDKQTGYLYYATGDSGPQFDPLGVAQDPLDLRGKLLRLDVNVNNNYNSELPYAIPADNPYASDPTKGAPEIVAMGLRNPWRFSIDNERQRIFIGDVGFNDRESIDLMSVGQWSKNAPVNFGWNTYEGSQKTRFGRQLATGTTHTPPIYDYPTGSNIGRAVVGGYALSADQYLFADFASGNLAVIEQQDKDANSKWRLKVVRTPQEWLSNEQRVSGVPALARDLSDQVYVVVWSDQPATSGLYQLDISN